MIRGQHDSVSGFSSPDVVSIAQCRQGDLVCIDGIVGAYTVGTCLSPYRLCVTLYDDTGEIDLLILGHRYIRGITTGQHLRVHGRVGVDQGKLVIFQPRFVV